MRSSSWPGPRGRVRKRSRSGWRDSGDRNRRTWSWPSRSARLTCRLRWCREATHAQHVPCFKPCYATATTAKDKLATEPWALGPCSEAVDAAYPCGWARRAAGKRPGSCGSVCSVMAISQASPSRSFKGRGGLQSPDCRQVPPLGPSHIHKTAPTHMMYAFVV